MDELQKEFDEWFMKLMWDKKHFPSCFWRDIIRQVKPEMRAHFEKNAKKFEATQAEILGVKK